MDEITGHWNADFLSLSLSLSEFTRASCKENGSSTQAFGIFLVVVPNTCIEHTFASNSNMIRFPKRTFAVATMHENTHQCDVVNEWAVRTPSNLIHSLHSLPLSGQQTFFQAMFFAIQRCGWCCTCISWWHFSVSLSLYRFHLILALFIHYICAHIHFTCHILCDCVLYTIFEDVCQYRNVVRLRIESTALSQWITQNKTKSDSM